MPYASNQGVRIHYEVEGQGPPLMMLHGLGSSVESLREAGYVSALEGEYQLILVDARGHGASDKPRDVEAYALELMARDLVAVLDDLRIDQAHYFGYSMGAGIGFRLPIYAPERFASLVLGGAAFPLKKPEYAHDVLLLGTQRALASSIARDANKAMEFYVTTLEGKFGGMAPRERTALLANDAQALLALLTAVLETVTPKAEEVLPLFSLPCLLFAGEADSRYLSVKECASRMPNASFFGLPELDHFQAGLRFDLILPHLKEFLDGVGTGRGCGCIDHG